MSAATSTFCALRKMANLDVNTLASVMFGEGHSLALPEVGVRDTTTPFHQSAPDVDVTYFADIEPVESRYHGALHRLQLVLVEVRLFEQPVDVLHARGPSERDVSGHLIGRPVGGEELRTIYDAGPLLALDGMVPAGRAAVFVDVEEIARSVVDFRPWGRRGERAGGLWPEENLNGAVRC